MADLLAYVDAVPGRLYPLVPTLQELMRRGHRVALRCGVDELYRMRSAGLAAEPLAPDIARFEPEDWRARTRFGALRSGLGQFGERARFQVPDPARGDRGRATGRPANRRGRVGWRGRGGAVGSPLGVHGRLADAPSLA